MADANKPVAEIMCIPVDDISSQRINDPNKIYNMVNPIIRNEIIEKINREEVVSETITGKKNRWWLVKHNPNNDIPKNIYLLGGGTISELHKKYIKNHGKITRRVFMNYTRELIQQKIMV